MNIFYRHTPDTWSSLVTSPLQFLQGISNKVYQYFLKCISCFPCFRSDTNTWFDLSRSDIRNLVDKINNIYQLHSEAPGFVVKIKGANSYSVTPANGSKKELPLCSYWKQCALCGLRSLRIHTESTSHSFYLVKSLSNTPLIIDKKQRSLHWFKMSPEAQVEMIVAAKHVASLFSKQASIKRSYLELHCNPAGFQTVGHTHLRIQQICNGSNPNDSIWENVKSI